MLRRRRDFQPLEKAPHNAIAPRPDPATPRCICACPSLPPRTSSAQASRACIKQSTDLAEWYLAQAATCQPPTSRCRRHDAVAPETFRLFQRDHTSDKRQPAPRIASPDQALKRNDTHARSWTESPIRQTTRTMRQTVRSDAPNRPGAGPYRGDVDCGVGQPRPNAANELRSRVDGLLRKETAHVLDVP
jgi:hypothetical protein